MVITLQPPSRSGVKGPEFRGVGLGFALASNLSNAVEGLRGCGSDCSPPHVGLEEERGRRVEDLKLFGDLGLINGSITQVDSKGVRGIGWGLKVAGPGLMLFGLRPGYRA